MNKTKFDRKTKEDRPVLAICYDFDKTLSPDNMQAQGYIQAIEFGEADFWQESNTLAEENDMDQNLAYMYMMVQGARGKVIFNRNNLMAYGAKVKLFPGVEEWFDRINSYGEQRGVIVEHYIISSGLKEMIEGTEIAKKGAFEKIYASSFYYDKDGVAVWPAQVINYTSKTQFLFRIEKGILDINDPGVNDFFPPEHLRVPFRNMVYIGDSDTDIPCMKLVNTYGGHSICVYNPEQDDRHKVYRLLADNRIKYFAPANYTEGSELDGLVKAIIDRTEMNERLETFHSQQKEEMGKAQKIDKRDEADRKKDDLIDDLLESPNFTYTLQTIHDLKQYKDWHPRQKEKLFHALLNNKQISKLGGATEVKAFYDALLEDEDQLSEQAKAVEIILRQLKKK